MTPLNLIRPGGVLLATGGAVWLAHALFLPQVPAPLFLAWVLLPAGILGVHTSTSRRTGIPGAIFAIAFAGIFMARFGLLVVDTLIAASGLEVTDTGGFEMGAIRVASALIGITGCVGFGWTIRRGALLPPWSGPGLALAGLMAIVAPLLGPGWARGADGLFAASLAAVGVLALRVPVSRTGKDSPWDGSSPSPPAAAS